MDTKQLQKLADNMHRLMAWRGTNQEFCDLLGTYTDNVTAQYVLKNAGLQRRLDLLEQRVKRMSLDAATGKALRLAKITLLGDETW